MNLRKRLEHIAEMSMRDRQMGRTTMIAKAAKATGGIVIARTMAHAKIIEREHDVPARSMEINLHGFSGPFFLDHFATEGLLMKASDKISQLEQENEQLRNMLSQIASIASKVKI